MDKYKICCSMEAGRSSWDSKCGLVQRLRLNCGLKKHGITHILFIVVLLAHAATFSEGQVPTTETPRFTFQLLRTPATWTDAAEECINLGTQVARIIDNETQAALEMFLQDEAVTGIDIWLGAMVEDSMRLVENPVPIWRSFPLASDTEELSISETMTRNAALFQGCFSDVTGNRDLPKDVTNEIGTENMTPDGCINQCRIERLPYAGVQVAQGGSGQDCFCGSTFGIHPPSGQCAVPCSGNANYTCGAFGHSQIYRVDGNIVNWSTQPMNPTNIPPVTECGVYNQGSDSILSLECVGSTLPVRYLCEIDMSHCSGTTPPYYQFTSTERGDICVYHSLAGTETGSWFYGRHECMNLGGDLLVLYTDQEFQAFRAVIPHIDDPFNQNRFAYIGLTRRSYYWPEARQLSEGIPMEYNNFGATEPDMERDCVYIDSDTGSWATADCDDLKQAVCLLEPISNIETSTSTNQPTTPDPPVAAGGAIYAAYALIGVLVVLLIVMVILALIRAKQKKNKVGAEPEAADCRENASKPEGGHLGSSLFHDIDEYESNSQYSTGSRRNLLTGSAYDLSASTVPGIAAGGPMMGKEEMSKINLD